MGSLLVLVLYCLGAVPKLGEDRLLPAIRTAYEANRAMLPFGTIRFRYAIGNSPDASSARGGGWPNTTATDGFYAFDGLRGHFETVFSRDQMVRLRRKTGIGQYSTTLSSMRVLTDGKSTLWDHVFVDDEGKNETHTAQIDASSRTFYVHVLCPLKLGYPEPKGFELGDDIGKALRSEGYTSTTISDDREDFEGVPVGCRSPVD